MNGWMNKFIKWLDSHFPKDLTCISHRQCVFWLIDLEKNISNIGVEFLSMEFGRDLTRRQWRRFRLRETSDGSQPVTSAMTSTTIRFAAIQLFERKYRRPVAPPCDWRSMKTCTRFIVRRGKSSGVDVDRSLIHTWDDVEIRVNYNDCSSCGHQRQCHSQAPLLYRI